ncbi:hypothetical protein CPLU01_09620 [Colletotrichum plurivorum]|uniref:Uncharacterized protein n=1 Tax=Colletotrichum plurivorum TaxID=2175906 RepID=A0A8H6NB99_9PEZI|nr:hypothetical protein CPLU01_09620 [Colletotrichum plurivorum]
MELLICIAEYVDQDYTISAPTEKILDYTTIQGQPGRFLGLGFSKGEPYYDIEDPSAHAKWRERHMRKNGDVLNLALANKRMLEACEPVLDGQLVLRGDERGRLASLRRILSETKPYLQKYVSNTVIEERGSSTVYRLWDEVGISFGPIFRDFTALTSLDIYTEGGYFLHFEENKKRTARWCRILPELTSLRRLSMTGFAEVDEFPLLPQLQEAYFHWCEPSEEFERGQFGGVWGAILKNLPALRTLVNNHSFGDIPDGGFRACKDTLETLVWDSSYYGFPEQALLELTCLKHLTVDFSGRILADHMRDSWRRPSHIRNLPQTVETLDVYLIDFRHFRFEDPDEPPEDDYDFWEPCYCETCVHSKGFWEMLEDKCRTRWRNVRLIRLVIPRRKRAWPWPCRYISRDADIIEKFKSNLGIKLLIDRE